MPFSISHLSLVPEKTTPQWCLPTVRGQDRAAFKDGMSRTFLWQGFMLRHRQIQTRKSPKAGPPKTALTGHAGAGMRLQSLNRREAWRVSRHLLKSSQNPVSAHRGIKVLCFSGKYPLKGEGRSSGPRWGFRRTQTVR
jgi:hypothetical protein